MLDTENNLISDENIIQYFLIDKKIPIESVYEKLQKFDEKKYLLSIAKFMQEMNPDYDINSVLTIISQNGLSSLDKYFTKIIKSKFPEFNHQEATRSQIIEKLYSLGCPELYYFHKTAKETSILGDDNKIIKPNPLTGKETWITQNFSDAKSYTRNRDRKPFVLAFPMLELSIAVENSDQERKPASFTTTINTVNFSILESDDLNNLLSKLKIFKIDK